MTFPVDNSIVAGSEAPKPRIPSVYSHGDGPIHQRWDIHVQEHRQTSYGPTVSIDVSNVIDGVLFRCGMSLSVATAFALGDALQDLREQIQGDEKQESGGAEWEIQS